METLFPELAEGGGAGILLALFFGTFVSEDLACLTAGSLAAEGRVELMPAVVACFLGIFVGDLLLYGAGRIFGNRIVKSSLFARFVSIERLDRGTDWLLARGASAIFVSRFVSGLRLPTYLVAGAVRMDVMRFAMYLALAGALWTPLLVGAAAVWQMTVPGGVIVGIVAIFFLFRFGFRMTDWKKRRIAVGRLRRIVQWEFWPLWVFYLPVVLFVLVLAVRYRGLAFTSANPGMPAGGFVGESKDGIYRLIGRSRAARPHLLPYTRLSSEHDADSRYRAALRFIDENSLSYPIVIKPDAGERGDGVSILGDDAQLRTALAEAAEDVLLQEHFEGVEASVFYYRRPSEQRGRIFSITEKCFPVVVGDGSSTLEELILKDNRAHIVAGKYFKQKREQLTKVPAEGQTVRLVEIGSHSKGAVFRDGEWLLTVELESKIDAVCREISGFYFGRFDLRATSFEDLKLGRDFRIIELNGVTSESTNIYDPRYSLSDAYRILFAQWQLAFEIGSENVALGALPSSIREILSLVLAKKSPKRRARSCASSSSRIENTHGTR